jgi:hypothetical protein
MRSVTALQPAEASALVFPARLRGEIGAIAAASNRVAPPAQTGAFGRENSRVPRSWALALGALAAWAVLVGGRAQAVRLIPQAGPLYAAVGLGVNLRHMELEKVVSRLADEDGRQILVVEGEIRNSGAAPRVAPPMRLAVLDSRGNEIYHWTAAPPKARLAAGEAAEFRARLSAPPKEGREVKVRFADASPGRDN